MKSKKFLAFALVTATLALAIVPSAFASTTAGTSTITVTTNGGGALLIDLNGLHESLDFGVTANTAVNTSSTLSTSTSASGDWIKITDGKGTGHSVDFGTDAAILAYSGLANTNDLTLAATSAIAADTAYLSYITPSIVESDYTAVTQTAGQTCTVSEENVLFNNNVASQALTATDVTLVANQDGCLGTWYYTLGSLQFKGPSNGLRVGEYSSAATVTVYPTSL